MSTTVPPRVLAQSGSQLPQPAFSAAANPEDIDTYGEELLRGPVHEAFAEQYNQDPIAGVTIDREPPPPVNEIPPEIRPEGDNVQWLSGYWFWDDDRSDFLWISGTWRVIPPGQRWLPGYWADSGGQHQWVAGSWVSTQQEAIEYIAQSPPESLDNGPAGIAPSDNHFWIPGCWTWTQNDYAWRPGYWSAGYSNWVWVPQRYLWTPRGYVFCNGYWDYPIARRGTLFAPFYFNQPVYARSNFFYSPRVSILASLLQSHFWVRPRYHHYYFGDFYADNYRNVGIIPWHSYHRGVGFQSRRYSFDPLFAHANLYNRSAGVNFYQQINNQYNTFVNQVDRRPALTYSDQLQRFDRDRGRGRFNDDRFNRGPGVGDRNEGVLGESIRDLAQRDPNRFTRLTTEQMTRFRNEARDVPDLVSLRREIETSLRGRDSGNRDRQTPGSDRSGLGRDATRGADSLAGRLQLPPVERGRIVGERQTESDRSRPEGRHSVGRPEIARPGNDRPGSDRPGSDRPGSDRPGNARPGSDRPDSDRPGSDRPGSDRPGSDRPGSDRPGTEVPGSDRPGSDRPGSERPGSEVPGNARPGSDRPGSEVPGSDRPGSDRPGSDRPDSEVPGNARPGNARPGNDLPTNDRPNIDRPSIGRPGSDRPGSNRPGIGRPGNELPTNDRPNIDRPSIGRPGSDRPDNGRPSIDRPSSFDRPSFDRPSFGRPSNDRPSNTRPSPDRPATVRPGTETPSARTPGAAGPRIETPSRDFRGGSPFDGNRFGDQIRERVPQSNRPNLSQPGQTLPGIGASPTRPQIGAPSTQPLRTPGFGDRSPGRLGSQMQTPAPAVRPSLDRSENGGRPSLTPNIQRPTAPATRPQFTPRPSGGARPEASPSFRGNRGGGDSGRGRGAAGGLRGQRD